MNGLKLADTLREYARKDYISFHTPGHKGKLDMQIPVFDVTELAETDNLFHPTGVIMESQKQLAGSLGCENAIFLPNGATSGNLGVFFALFREGDKVLVDRNCHISVINALVLCGAMPVFAESRFLDQLPLPMDTEHVKNLLLKHPDIKGIFVTSPNYYGMLADIAGLSRLAERFSVPLIVDEAHGTHLYYLENGRMAALKNGADIAVLSLHKNLPVLTQCGCICYNDKRYDILKQGVKYFTSTSPSYLLMGSIDQLPNIMEQSGLERLHEITSYTLALREKIKTIPYLSLVESPRYDPDRLTVSIRDCNASAEEMETFLKRQYRIVCEMTDPGHLVFIVSMCNTEAEIATLYQALCAASEHFGGKQSGGEEELPPVMSRMMLTPRKAHDSQKEEIPVDCAVGCISGENIICFPPSVPIVVLGEEVTEKTVENIKKFTGRKKLLVIK